MKKNNLLMFLALLLIFSGTGEAAQRSYSLKIRTGLGYDSNVFLAPDKSYFDPVENRVVKPDKRSGFFVPVSIDADFRPGGDKVRFVTFFDLDARIYPRREINNADTYLSELRAGVEVPFGGKSSPHGTFFIGPSFAYNRELYFDRDTGEEKITRLSRQRLGDRNTYLRRGLETRFRLETGVFEVRLLGEASKYDYEEVPVTESLDYDYYFARGEASVEVAKPTTLSFRYSGFIYDFEDRRARDIRGDLEDGTHRRYGYYGFGTSLGNKIGELWTVDLMYDRLNRIDRHVGYYDYGKNEYSVRARYRDGTKRRFSAAVSYWDREYPRAFAFDDPAFPHKAYKTWEAKVLGEIPISKSWKLWTEYEFIDPKAADPRYDYKRHTISAGLGAEL